MDKSKIPVEQRAALGLLMDDHRAVKKLFKQFESAKDAEKQSIAMETCQKLTVHAQIEEEIFYPALRGVAPARRRVPSSCPRSRARESLLDHRRAPLLPLRFFSQAEAHRFV